MATSNNKTVKKYEFLCFSCLTISTNVCFKHPHGCKYCTYCTEDGCDFNTCPERKYDEDLISKFEKAREQDKSFPCEQDVALAYESIDRMNKRLGILSAVKGLNGLKFLNKAKEILSDSHENPNPVRIKNNEIVSYENNFSLCLDCTDFISCHKYHKCSKHSHLINKCLSCRAEGHIYQNCREWIHAKEIIASCDSYEPDHVDWAKYLIIDTLTRTYIIHSLKTKSQEERRRTNIQIRDDAVYDANTDFDNGRY